MNEAHEAEYTPSVEEVQRQYATLVIPNSRTAQERTAEFNRMIERVRREVAAETLRAVIAQMELTESRMPEWAQRGYREGRFKVQHILGVLLNQEEEES